MTEIGSLNMRKILESTRARVIEAAQDDWIYLAEVSVDVIEAAREQGVELWSADFYQHASSTIRTWYGDGWRSALIAEDSPSIRQLVEDPWLSTRVAVGMEVISALLEGGLLVPGDLRSGFEQWEGSTDEWIKRIEAGWRAYGALLAISDVAWFEYREG